MNLASGTISQSTAFALAIVCTPLYIRLLGIESYALIAFYILLQSISQLFDFGLGPTVNRVVAGWGERAEKHDDLISFLRTVEAWYWALGMALGAVAFFGLPWLARSWLRPDALASGDLTSSAQVFAALALLQWPTLFYQNWLIGMQRHGAMNSIVTPLSIIASLGGLLLIWLGPRSVAALLAWQAGTACVQLALLQHFCWRYAGGARIGRRVPVQVLREHWRFSAGMTGISITGIVIVYLDKIILSRLLPLEVFAHYNLATSIARGLNVFVSPIFTAYVPRLSALVAAGDEGAVVAAYRTATQIMVALVFPIAAVLIFFAEPIAFLWLRNDLISRQVAPLMVPLVAAAALNSLTHVPFALQLAHARIRVGLLINVALCVFLLPAILLATSAYGAWGAATCWLIANIFSVAVSVPLTHRMFGVIRSSEWLAVDVLSGALLAICGVWIISLVLSPQGNPLSIAVTVGLVWILVTFGAAWTLPRTRLLLRGYVRSIVA
jgi:O-antigen/teichoic acid export membrane protein